MDALDARDVFRQYGETVALDGVSLSVETGAVFALVGPNGAGKTTLVRALLGTTDAVGTVEVFGKSTQAVDRERIGLLPQSFSPAARLTARELVAYYGGLYEDAQEPAAVLDDVGMTEAADTHYENLSGGQQRRTCVATTLVNDPDLLVLDEPTTGIDPTGRRQLWRLLEGLADAGTTIFITTHYMAEAERLADRVGLLSDGSLVAVDTPSALIADYGGDSRLEIEGDVPPAIVDEFDHRATVEDGSFVVRDVAPRAIGDVVEVLDEAGVAYESLTWTEPDLEDVFLELTGQSLTEGSEEAVAPTASVSESTRQDSSRVEGSK